MTLGILKRKTIISNIPLWYAQCHDVKKIKNKKTLLKIKLLILTNCIMLAVGICDFETSRHLVWALRK